VKPNVSRPGVELVLGDAAALVAAVPVEKGRVRSRKLFAGSGATIMGLVMDAGAVMREHHAPVPILIQLAEGEALLEVEGRRIALVPGALVHVETGVRHGLEALAESRLLLVLLGGAEPAAAAARPVAAELTARGSGVAPPP
jgi:quercetin dioxygenase-like cupin family protein